VMALARTGGWQPVSGEEFLPTFGEVLTGLTNILGGQPLAFSTHWWYWNPTRVMVHTGNAINEIPYFTFLYGDPHAHAFAMPLTLLVVGWLIHEVLAAGRVKRTALEATLALAFGALVVAILQPTNFADWLTYFVLSLFLLTVANYLRLRAHQSQEESGSENADGTLPEPGPGWRAAGWFGGIALYRAWHLFRGLPLTRAAVLRWLGQLLGFALFGAVAIAPFTTWYATADAVPGFWEGEKTPLWAYLDLNGLFLFLVISLLVWDTARHWRTIRVGQLAGRRSLVIMTLAGLGWLALIVLVAALAGYTTALIALPVVFWAALLFFRAGQAPQMRIVWAIVVLTVALTFVVDVIVWAGDIGRQNTVFKFYMQVWLMLSVVGGAALAWVLRASRGWRELPASLWRGAAILLFTVAGMYPVLATQARFVDRMAPETPLTLNGMDYMQHDAIQGENGVWFSLEEDYDLIRWMQENIQGTPVILESQSAREYLWGSRISVYTGLPTLVGWNFHQRQQRTLEPLSRLVQHRILNVNTLYTTIDVYNTWTLLRQFDVRYIVVGQLERAYYPAEGLAKFDRMVAGGLLELVYEQGETRLYAVNPDAVV
ncbi:MAG: hypothetical protein JXN59_03905, partial [Anaerolineae bacterium]|nr:hypothetical protein [Anaerolineae bacterium]